jgi:prepilin-type N-terminal cleavage/methylation domain-containing protein
MHVKRCDMARRRHGFTLVELAIVLAILALLAGGVLLGQSLIRSAQMRSLVTEYGRFSTALKMFKEQYSAIPGDMKNATAYWGANDGSTGLTAGCFTTPSTTQTTCNGNGDGLIGYYGVTTGANELFSAWKHLANAELIAGSYTGVQDGADNWSLSLKNAPPSKVHGALWFIANWNDNFSNATDNFDGEYRDNIMQLINYDTVGYAYRDILSPAELWSIDKKIDDGKPAYGVVQARQWNTCTNAANSADLASDYLFTSKELKCSVLFRDVI